MGRHHLKTQRMKVCTVQISLQYDTLTAVGFAVRMLEEFVNASPPFRISLQAPFHYANDVHVADGRKRDHVPSIQNRGHFLQRISNILERRLPVYHRVQHAAERPYVAFHANLKTVAIYYRPPNRERTSYPLLHLVHATAFGA